MRIAGTNIDSMDIAGVIIDGGAATDIVGNLIEGNAGPAIIVTAGWWGAPMGVTIESNYCERTTPAQRFIWHWCTPSSQTR
eukprot:SAG22_NODE_150_length_17426_cov_8.082588_4_plen_81_part_00